MSFKPEFLVNGAWSSNAQRFATEDEARTSAVARMAVWFAVDDYRATESPDPVNYVRVDGADHSLVISLLASDDVGDCPTCGAPALQWGARGFTGYVDACKEHAVDAIVDAIHNHLMEVMR